MKKHFLILASLVLGIGQLFADEVTFKASELHTTTTTATLPYTWAGDSYVSIVLNGTETQTQAIGEGNISFSSDRSFTVTGKGNTAISKVVIASTNQNSVTKASVDTGSYTTSGATGTWVPEDGTTPTSVTFTATGTFAVKTITVTYTPDPNYTPDDPVVNTDPLVGPFEATPIESIASYTGTDQYVFDMAARKYYALNNLGEYEEFGLYPEVSTLKVAGGGATEIEYIKTTTSMGTIPYINTGYIPQENTRVMATVNMNPEGVTGTWKAVFGAGFWGNGWESRLCFFSKGNEYQTLSLKGETAASANTWNQKVIVDVNNSAGTAYVYDATDGSTVLSSITEVTHWDSFSLPLYVFAQNKKTAVDCYNPSLIMYGMQIYEGETLVMDLVPAVDGEGNGGLKDKLTGTFYGSANEANFELSADGQAIAADAGISVYPGKLVINTTDNHEYNWNGDQWVDLGSVYEPITATDYKNLTTWTTNSDHTGVFSGKIAYDATAGTNLVSPYVGTGGWEPLWTTVSGLTKGETYRVSFKHSTNGWVSWNSSYTTLPVYAFYDDTFNQSAAPTSGSNILGMVSLSQAAQTDKEYSFTFTATETSHVLCIQFGVVNDGDQGYWFNFDDLNIQFVNYPQKYSISWADPNKYTPLAYIESTSAARANAYTLPYTPVTKTQIDTKFKVYDTSSGWCGIFCARNTYAGTGISLYMNGNKANFGYFTGGTTGAGDTFAPFTIETDYEVTADVTKLVVNGETYETGNTVTNATTRNLSLFANPEWDNPMRGRFYYCTISEGGETVYDFQPVMRHDGQFGFYDAATMTFVLPAQGTLDGYGYATIEGESYVTYSDETRIVMVGGTAQYLPEVLNLDGATFTWTSSDETKATVDENGTVTGIAAGTVTITATTDADEGWTASYELTVSEPTYLRHDANGVGYAIVTGGSGWGDSPLSALIDNDATTKFGTSNGSDAWAIIIASEPVAVQQYSIVTGADTYNYPSRNPVSWKLEGSNDNQTWTVIDEKVQTYQLQAKNKEQFDFTVNGTETYKFFKFTATQLADGFQMGEFWINAQTHTWGDPAETAATCTVLGQNTWTCSDCGTLKTEVLPLAAHAYENGVCTVCSAKASEVTLLPTRNGDSNTPYYVKFRHANEVTDDEYVDYEAGWADADYDDSAWDELMMPLGSFGPYHTRWFGGYNTFWFRRSFYIDNPAAITKLTLKVTHDDDCAVFLNGKKVWNEFNWTGGENDWRTVDIAPADLVEGNNVLAMYIEQNFGGAYCDFGLDANVGATIEVTDAGYATFVAPVDVDFTGSDVTPKAAAFDGEYVQLADVTTVPAGTAVVVKADEGTYTVPATTDAALGTANELVAATADVTADGTQYILAKVDEKVGFAQATAGTTIATGKGYLVISAPVKGFYPFGDDDATGINGVNGQWSMVNGETIYNVAGQRIGKMQKGVNIVGSKKVMVK